ncbi:MAG: cation diffusion facilitator family transporter [Melioribacteraceae bacterium]|nr:cation diffusion facilitator family transporter [Melioribacteraceae bacterium]
MNSNQKYLDNVKKKSAQLSLLIGILLFGIKLAAYFITGSSAIFSDAAESVVNIVAAAFTFYSIIVSSKPPDKSHLYGHGNVEYFAAGFEGLLIILAAVTILYTSIIQLIEGHELSSLNIGTMLVGGAGIVNFGLGFYLVKKGRATNSPALIADGKHILSDSYTSFGVVIGLIIVLITGLKILDPIVAIIVALNILITGFKIVRESVGDLMNETDMALLQKIVEHLNSERKNIWIDIHQLRFWKSADKLFIDFHLIMPYYFSIKDAHKEEEIIRKLIEKKFTNAQLNLHIDYCSEVWCSRCLYDVCHVRMKPFEKKIDWTIEKMISPPSV